MIRGFFLRKHSQRRIRRFQCRVCQKSFSEASWEPEFHQRKRDLNEAIRKLLCSSVSQRRTALLLGVSRKTVARKFRFLAQQAKLQLDQELKGLSELPEAERPQALHFDEMESFVHTKLKPVSIPLLVDKKSRRIYGISVASMPAKGPLAQLSRQKYGRRADDRAQVADHLLRSLAPSLHPKPQILSDQKSCYPRWLKSVFPKCTHQTTKGRRGCVVGQGELKKTGYDPLFSLNHTAAMIRAQVNRLARKTWCTSKRLDQLLAHLQLYAHWHNTMVLSSPARTQS